MPTSVRDLFYLLALGALIGAVLHLGRTVLVPVVVAIMLTYVIVGAVDALGRVPFLGHAPVWLRYVAAVATFLAALALIGLLAAANLRGLTEVLPAYEANLRTLLDRVAAPFGATGSAAWEGLRALTIDRIDVGPAALWILNTLASAGAYLVLIVTYVVFLLPERTLMPKKLRAIAGNRAPSGRQQELLAQINAQITSYLSAKTAINVVLGVLSFAILVVLGVEFAVFWSMFIALANYVPYIGSLAAVALVVLQILAQTGSLETTLLGLGLLVAAQVYVGNWLEPRWLSRSSNLGPFVVLLSLVAWSALWGMPGAILAVPLTSILMIVLAAAPQTRAIAILMSRDGRIS
ncbi:AI-2E family transporter [Salinarimonas ramus]|uniref:AI-2E family transporter n=1 Tax=Salinarimonas ramus TaxID=690164 RepID=A0A917Q8D8_9HYPH|nr:AI-2E family transporter [Salinarimonas ramus]GGK31496.1 AI-2E family transporter [Salinarimonas ramus]